MQPITSVQRVVRQDRAIVMVGLVGITTLAWAYVVYLSWDMRGMDMAAMSTGMAMAQEMPWGAVDFFLTFLMWSVMMIAMMLPSASPMILMFITVSRARREQKRLLTATGVFVGGYGVVWTGFAAAATLAQWGLHTGALLAPQLASTSPILGGVLLLASGIYQWSHLKYACLSKCRTPLGFIMSEWREGKNGAFVMGLRHGVFCLGCCWVLMSLLFVLGVMNLLWIAVLAAFVLLEKVAPKGLLVSRITGVVLVLAGAWMILLEG